MSIFSSSQNIDFKRQPHPKEIVCGDDGAAWDDGDDTWIMISDGLGHGEGAAEATRVALDWLAENFTSDVETTVRGCDRAIRHTRGISLNLVKIDRPNRQATYLSIGANLGWKVQRNGTRRISSNPGIVGAGVSTFRPVNIDLSDSGYLVLASDGIQPLANVSELYSQSYDGESSIANQCLKRWTTGRDDASILIYRFTS